MLNKIPERQKRDAAHTDTDATTRPGRLDFTDMKTYFLPLATGIALIMAAAVVAAAESGPFYRVEIIVFAHSSGNPDARITDTLASFTDLVDPLAVPEDAQPSGGEAEDLRAAIELLETLETLESGPLPELPAWPKPYIALDQLSGQMLEARQRLERSPHHEVLAWRAWHQPLVTGRSPMRVRIHDENVIGADWIELHPTETPALQEPSSAGTVAPAPSVHYRLDGGIGLTRRQFVNADIELHWREPVSHQPAHSLSERQRDGEYAVHRLSQRRAVRPERLEYFDSSWLGVLMLIQRLEPPGGSGPETESSEANGEN